MQEAEQDLEESGFLTGKLPPREIRESNIAKDAQKKHCEQLTTSSSESNIAIRNEWYLPLRWILQLYSL